MSGQPMSNANFRRATGIHRLLLRLSGGRVGHHLAGMKVVVLHTVGRTSGLPRETVLSTPIRSSTGVVLVASKGGSHGQPDWYLNLQKTPDVELTIDGECRPYRARTVSPEEKADLWPRIVTAYKGYAAYQERTQRDIPVVLCEPRRG